MLDRLLSGFQADAPPKLVAAAMERAEGQPSMVVLDTLYTVLRDGLANAPGGSMAERWLEAITPAAEVWVTRALAELAVGEDNPVRRDLSARRLTLLADQIAHVCYVEAARADAALRKGSGRVSTLVEWTVGYYRWLGRAHTARAMLDCHVHLPWESICSLYRAMAAHGALPAKASPASREPALGLAYLLLVHDAFPATGEHRVAAVAAIVGQLASKVVLADDFHRITPYLMSPESGEAQRMVGWRDSARHGGIALFYGLDEVAERALALATDAAGGQGPPWLREVHEAAGLLRGLVHVWVERTGRCRNPMLSSGQTANAAFGWLRIRGLLAQKTSRLPTNDPLICKVALDDANETGVSLLLAGASLPLLGDGVLALRIGGRWWLAQPQRIEPEPDGLCFIVARWLAQEADSIRLASGSGEAWRAVYLHPGPANHYQAAVLVDSGKLVLGASCTAELGDASLTLEPLAVEALGPALWRYDCARLET